MQILRAKSLVLNGYFVGSDDPVLTLDESEYGYLYFVFSVAHGSGNRRSTVRAVLSKNSSPEKVGLYDVRAYTFFRADFPIWDEIAGMDCVAQGLAQLRRLIPIAIQRVDRRIAREAHFADRGTDHWSTCVGFGWFDAHGEITNSEAA